LLSAKSLTNGDKLKLTDAMEDTHIFFTGALCFLCQISLKTTHPTHAEKVKAILIKQGQYE
jgi:hypothetical protein